MPISEAEINAIRSHLTRSFKDGTSQDATRDLDQLIAAIRERQTSPDDRLCRDDVYLNTIVDNCSECDERPSVVFI